MSSHHPSSYYTATLNNSARYSSLGSDIHVGTCIIGGGYAGLMTQLGLLERGEQEVALLENHRVGWGASGRNGGFVFAGYSLSPKAMCDQVGQHHARELYQLSVKAVDTIRERIETYAIDCDRVDRGAIWINWFNDQKVLLNEQAFMEEVMGVQWQYISPDELHERIKSKRYHGGLFETNAMHFHPLNYAYGIAQGIDKLGGRIYEDTQAIAVDTNKKIVKTKKGIVHYQNLVICGGGYLANFFPKISRAVLPVATYIMVTEPLTENCCDHIFTEAAIYDTRFAFDYYRKLNDGRLLWGGRISANTNTPADLEKKLRNDIKKVFPKLTNVRIDYIWDGWMGYSRHKMPCIGCIENNVWYNMAFGGHGVGPTTVGGELIASAIAEEDDHYRLFAPWGLPWTGGRLGPIAAQASYWWYQSKDWLKEVME